MGGKGTVKAPDMRPYADAMMASGESAERISQEQLAWAREQDTNNRAVLDRVLGVQLPAMEEQAGNAREDRQRYEDVFRPLEDNLVQDFQTFDSPERRGLERGRAAADVTTSFDAARRNALQRLEGFGIDPSQTRNAALDIGVRSQQAAATAGAMTNATRNVEDKARALRADAVNLGRGGLSNVASSYGQAVQAGNSGVAGANNTSAVGGANMGNPTAWGGMAQSGYGGAANITNQGFQNQMASMQMSNANNANMWSNIAGGVGMVAGVADGGRVRNALRGYADGQEPSIGYIADGPGDGSGIDDQVPTKVINPKTGEVEDEALVSTEEYIIPADVVRIKGVEFFDRLVEKYHKPAVEQRAEMRRALPA
jgi:hypothetical protein